MHVDLRSDTITIPSKEMLNAILSAKVGDDVYGEDPTVRELEKKLAAMFGMDVAMFFPSGTMANQTAIKLHTNPGDQVICDKYSHVFNYEGGGGAFNSGVSFKLINGNRGMFNSNQLLESINPREFYHSPLSSLVTIEKRKSPPIFCQCLTLKTSFLSIPLSLRCKSKAVLLFMLSTELALFLYIRFSSSVDSLNLLPYSFIFKFNKNYYRYKKKVRSY